MTPFAALQWLMLAVSIGLAGICVGVGWKCKWLRPLAWAWLFVAVNHIALYAIAFIFLEERIGLNATQIWSTVTRIHIAATGGLTLLVLARGRL